MMAVLNYLFAICDASCRLRSSLYLAIRLSASVFSPLPPAAAPRPLPLFGIAAAQIVGPAAGSGSFPNAGPALCSLRRLTSRRMLRLRFLLSADDAADAAPNRSDAEDATWCFAVLT